VSAAQAATALAVGVESHEEVAGPENGAQRCVRKPGSTWTACRCSECHVRRCRESKLYRCGRLQLPDRDAAMARVLWWIDMGWEPSAIASATGLTLTGTQAILGRVKAGVRFLQGHTVAAVLGAGRPTSGRMLVVGTRRRLQALAWNGWTLEAISERTGVPMMSLSNARTGARRLVSVATRNAVADVYEQLQNQHQQGGSGRAAFIARKRGWAPPAAWDDDTIDDPGAQPEGLVQRGRRTTDPLIVEDIADLHRVGYTDREIATRLGFNTPDAVAMIRRRHLKRAAA